MTLPYDLLQFLGLLGALLLLAHPLGTFMAQVYNGERTFLSPILAPCESLFYRICGAGWIGTKIWAGSVTLMPCCSSTWCFS